MRRYAIDLIASVIVGAFVALPGIATADEDFSIVINGRTGAAFLRNDSDAAVDLDGYLVRSPRVDGVFDMDSWSSLTDNATAGWLESRATDNRFGEANLFGSTSVGPGETIGIGSPYVPFVPGAIGEREPGIGSIDFSYSVVGGDVLVGDVEFVDRNTVVLVVDPATGEAALENQSDFDINIDSYLIQSVPAVLDVDNWTPLETSLGSEEGWFASTGVTNRIAEGNLFGSTPLAANGGRISLGAPIDPVLLDDETDLFLEYTIDDVGSLLGGVLFAAAAAPGVPGDYNGNGTVDAADYTVFRDNMGQSITLPNEGAGISPGVVDQDDYDFWKMHFGDTAGSGSGAGALVRAGAVPEPATCLLAGLAAMALGLVRLSRGGG